MVSAELIHGFPSLEASTQVKTRCVSQEILIEHEEDKPMFMMKPKNGHERVEPLVRSIVAMNIK
jgi:hypothetical protein